MRDRWLPFFAVAALLAPPAAAGPPSPAPAASPAVAEPAPAPAASARPGGKPFRIEPFRWQAELKDLGSIERIEVRNDFGDIRARYGGDRRIEVVGAIQRLGREGEDLAVNVERRGGVIAVVAALSPGRVAVDEAEPGRDAFDRVDLTVFVPLKVTLQAQTLRGRFEARRLESDVEASTLQGDLVVVTNGAVQARTRSGKVRVALGSRTGERPLLVESVDGPITVSVPAAANLRVRAETGGELKTDLPLAVSPAEPSGRRRLEGDHNQPLQALLVSSTKGTVSVLKEPVPQLLEPSPAPAPSPGR